MILADALHPVTFEEFASRILGKTWTLQPGAPGRFASLLSWDELNDILNLMPVAGNRRLRIVKEGKDVPQEIFAAPTAYGASLRTAALESLLADGATLVLNAVDELHTPVRRLAEDIEDSLRLPHVQVNLYAGWRSQRGFNLHWDDHDTLILQLHGRKQWTVYEPTFDAPLKGVQGMECRPDGPPIWSGVIEQGTLLYMPRGWWHVAEPLDAPTLHLTFGITHLTGEHLIGWLRQELRKETAYRRDMPLLGDAAAKTAYVARLKECVAALLDDRCIDRVIEFAAADVPGRPFVRLADGAKGANGANGSANGQKMTAGSSLRLSSGKVNEYMRLPDGRVGLEISGTQWWCANGVANALRTLSGRRWARLEELEQMTPGEKSRRELGMTLEALRLAGIIVVR